MAMPARNSRVVCERIWGAVVGDGQQQRQLPVADHGVDGVPVAAGQCDPQRLGGAYVGGLPQALGLQGVGEGDLDLGEVSSAETTVAIHLRETMPRIAT